MPYRSPSVRAGLLALACAGPAFCQQPLNLITIVTDDQGRWAMGAYGNAEVRTPHIDAIAASGALFERAFATSPVCSPARASWLSGRYPSEHGITDWIAPHQAAEGRGLDAPTWPDALRAAGWRTGLFGKWHLGDAAAFHPTRRGFDEFGGFLGGGTKPMDAVLEVDGERVKTAGPLPDRLTDMAIDFARRHARRPFALSLHFRAPHRPYGPVPAVDAEPYADLEPALPDVAGLDTAAVARNTVGYYASVSSIDRNVGRLLAAVDELGIAGRTIVWFTSDHGYNQGRHGIDTKGNGHWIIGGRRGPKRPNMWDTSLAVPMAIRWPGVIAPGTRVTALVGHIDTYRTALGMLGVAVPAGAEPHGVDLAPMLRGAAAPERTALFGSYDLHNSGVAFMRMVRTERWKLVRHLRAEFMDELYDLAADPGETRNLLRGKPRGYRSHDEARRLDAVLAAWMTEIGDPLAELMR